jgi:hypothetical protein
MVQYPAAVHASAIVKPGCRPCVLAGVWIDHLSHPDVAAWIEKTNRYTSQPQRSGPGLPDNLAAFAHARMDLVSQADPYLDAVAVLRALYDIVDVLKRWEATQPNGHEVFHQFCQAIEQEPR